MSDLQPARAQSTDSIPGNPSPAQHGTPTITAEANPAGLRVLSNTYRLLSMTLLFSAAVAATSAALNLPHPGLLITLVGYFGLLFLTSYLRNSAW